MIRLGGPIFGQWVSPDHWARLHAEAGYRAAYCPIQASDSDSEARSFVDAAERADLMIAEVGAWSNPIDRDPAAAARSIAYCTDQLALAERIGARCCVNITGSRHPQQWDAPHPENFSDDTFDLIVETTRAIIDAVQPRRTHYALEAMPWAYPSSADEYLRLIEAIDRPALGVHLDPVNMVKSPAISFNTTGLLRECFEKLGPFIRSAHAKDVALLPELTVQLREVPPGQGVLDYPTFLRLLSSLPEDTPVMLEHLDCEASYAAAARHIRAVAQQNGLTVDRQ